MTEPVLLDIENGIGHLRLNRPQSGNALNLPLARSLNDAVEQIADDEAVQVVFLSGQGPRFCVGGDVATFVEAEDQSVFLTSLAADIDSAVQRLEALPKPVVAAVHGAVAGGGLGVMLAADVIFAAEDTKFAFAYPSIGLTPDCGTSVSLPRAMGLRRALGFVLSGSALTARQAMEQGLITGVESEPVSKAREVALRWVSGSPVALGQARRQLRQNAQRCRSEAGEDEAATIGEMAGTAEAQYRMQNFLKR